MVTIRQERQTDYRKTEEVVQQAFYMKNLVIKGT